VVKAEKIFFFFLFFERAWEIGEAPKLCWDRALGWWS